MRCTDLHELLSAYSNGELSLAQREFVEEHLATCNDCQITLADFAEVRRHLLSLKAVPVRPDIKRETMAKINGQKPLIAKPGSRYVASLKNLVAPVFRQPKWGIVVASVFVLVLAITLCVSLWPSQGGKSDTVLAEEIANNSGVFKVASLTQGGATITGVDLQANNLAIVNFYASNGNQIAAQVDLEEKKLKLVEIKFPGSELTEDEKTLAIEIAQADPRVVKFLNQGMSVQMINSVPLQGEGKIIDVVFLPEQPKETEYIQGKYVRVDIGKKAVLSISDVGMIVPSDVLLP